MQVTSRPKLSAISFRCPISTLELVRGQSKNYLKYDTLSAAQNNQQRDLRMARLRRLFLSSIPQHVIQRGNNRQARFYAEQDYRFYLECLGEAARKYRVSVHAYVLMTNHVHLLMTSTPAEGTSQVVQTLGRRYVRYINHAYRRRGTQNSTDSGPRTRMFDS